MMRMDKIRIIMTGGTFDKHYDELAGALTFKDSHLREILEYSRCTLPVELEANQLKDSLDMSDEDREQILASCKSCPEKRIVIIHGTDTMTQTAEKLAREIKDKTIIITGAMIPYPIRKSDALFNFGCALNAVQLMPQGVHIAMNGRIFEAGHVRKNREKGIFEEI
ncbi:MAG: asparaginase domain-containing protein [Spirochaetales bacterium]|nr:asparaginase domain-containing protein [Spirochaetales bacterium]